MGGNNQHYPGNMFDYHLKPSKRPLMWVRLPSCPAENQLASKYEEIALLTTASLSKIY
jgi:hypothetical protein